MEKYIYLSLDKPPYSRFLKKVDAEPECGEDFCDSCGDCLHCYSGDPCHRNDSGKHFWVEYQEELEID
jgi:hypothetical protein